MINKIIYSIIDNTSKCISKHISHQMWYFVSDCIKEKCQNILGYNYLMWNPFNNTSFMFIGQITIPSITNLIKQHIKSKIKNPDPKLIELSWKEYHEQ